MRREVEWRSGQYTSNLRSGLDRKRTSGNCAQIHNFRTTSAPISANIRSSPSHAALILKVSTFFAVARPLYAVPMPVDSIVPFHSTASFRQPSMNSLHHPDPMPPLGHTHTFYAILTPFRPDYTTVIRSRDGRCHRGSGCLRCVPISCQLPRNLPGFSGTSERK